MYFLDTHNIFVNFAGVEAHWGDIGAAMYPVFLEASSVCGQLGACKKVEKYEKSIDSGLFWLLFSLITSHLVRNY